MSDQYAELNETDWFMSIRVLEHDRDEVKVCLTDQAVNGGTYFARTALVLHKSTGTSRVVAKLTDDVRCRSQP